MRGQRDDQIVFAPGDARQADFRARVAFGPGPVAIAARIMFGQAIGIDAVLRLLIGQRIIQVDPGVVDRAGISIDDDPRPRRGEIEAADHHGLFGAVEHRVGRDLADHLLAAADTGDDEEDEQRDDADYQRLAQLPLIGRGFMWGRMAIF